MIIRLTQYINTNDGTTEDIYINTDFIVYLHEYPFCFWDGDSKYTDHKGSKMQMSYSRELFLKETPEEIIKLSKPLDTNT